MKSQDGWNSQIWLIFIFMEIHLWGKPAYHPCLSSAVIVWDGVPWTEPAVLAGNWRGNLTRMFRMREFQASWTTLGLSESALPGPDLSFEGPSSPLLLQGMNTPQIAPLGRESISAPLLLMGKESKSKWACGCALKQVHAWLAPGHEYYVNHMYMKTPFFLWSILCLEKKSAGILCTTKTWTALRSMSDWRCHMSMVKLNAKFLYWEHWF